MSGPAVQQYVSDHPEHIKRGADSILALGAMALPAWVDGITTWLGLIAAFGGVALLGLRIYMTILEIRARKKEE